MEIWKRLSEGTVRLGIPARDKAEVFATLIEGLVEAGQVAPELPVLEEVLRREQVLSTGVGNGVALPHARLEDFSGFALAFGRPAEPIDVGAVDALPADLFFLLIADRRDPSSIVRILGRLARLCDREETRDGLRSVQTPEQAIELLKRGEAATPAADQV
jgi:mannitol/fructose-specific phosphotransferase system IIA component (Ntr-type)